MPGTDVKGEQEADQTPQSSKGNETEGSKDKNVSLL